MELIKRIIGLAMAFFAQFQLLLPGAELVTRDLGIPTRNSYTQEQRLASSVWDMEIWDGVLYVGAGDYGANTGATPVWAYDMRMDTWVVSATVEDEAVSRFCTVDNALVIPGIDAAGTSWKYGNYHTLDHGQWTSFQMLPGAVHNFDVTFYEDRYFYALGTADGKASPVLVSADGTSDFESIPFYKGEKPLLNGRYSHTRVYDFFTTDNGLYCLLYCYSKKGIAARMYCRYEDGAFCYVSDADFTPTPWKQLPVMGKAVVGGEQYFTTGTLYKTADFLQITPVELPDGGTVTDLYTYRLGKKQLLYALSNIKNEDDTYTATVYLLGNGATAIASYTATVPALSLVRSGMHFYIGLGGSKTLPDTGKVVRLSVFDRLLDP